MEKENFKTWGKQNKGINQNFRYILSLDAVGSLLFQCKVNEVLPVMTPEAPQIPCRRIERWRGLFKTEFASMIEGAAGFHMLTNTGITF